MARYNQRVSVIVPCYNYASFLSECVQSVLSQEGVEVEVLIIDDCSQDDTPKVGAVLASHPRVEYRRHPANRGHIATYNEGLNWSESPYTVLLSADDLLTPGSLARAASVMDCHPQVGMAYGGAPWFETSNALPRVRTGNAKPRIWKGVDWIDARCKRATSTIASPEVMVRTACYKTLGGYRDDLPHTADLEMWLRIAAHADIAFLKGVDQALYRAHRKSMSRTTFGAEVDDLRHRKLCFDILFDSSPLASRDVARWRESTNQALAREALWRGCRLLDKGEVVDSHRVQALEGFAYEVYAGAWQLPESRLLASRRRIGSLLCPLIQYAQPSVYVHRLRRTILSRRAYATGV